MHLAISLPLRKAQRGFALIATLSLMMLIAIIAVGLLTLSSVTLRTARADKDMATARANARMALVLAIGQLQKYAGADQRVTANAAILEEAKVNGAQLANRNWVGVWRTDGKKADKFPGLPENAILTRKKFSPESRGMGSVVDLRSDFGFDHKKEVLEWLVSNPTPSGDLAKMVENTYDEKTSVLLLKNLGTTVNQENLRVRAPKVPVQNATNKLTGSYAYWVSDQSQMAQVNLAKRENATPEESFTEPGQMGISQVVSNPTDSTKFTFPEYKNLTNDDIKKIYTRKTVELIKNIPPPEELVKNVHDLTFESNGLLVDTLNGGFRRDLTAFLNTGTIAAGRGFPLLNSNTTIIDADKTPALNQISPRFGLLKSWADLSTKISGNAIDVQLPNLAGNKLALNQNNQAGVHPVLVEYGTSMSVVLIRNQSVTTADANGELPYYIGIVYYPRIVLWNPYDVDIKAANYTVKFRGRYMFNLTFQKPGPQVPTLRFDGNYAFGPAFYSPGEFSNASYEPVFSLPDVSLKAGQAQVFTADTGDADYKVWPIYKDGADASFEPWISGSKDKVSKLKNYRLTAKKSSKNPNIPKGFVLLFTNSFNPYTINAKEADVSAGNVRGKIDYTEIANWYHFGKVCKLWKETDPINEVMSNKYKADYSSSFTSPNLLQYMSQTENGVNQTYKPRVNLPDTAIDSIYDITRFSQGKPMRRVNDRQRVQWFTEKQDYASGTRSPYHSYNLFVNHNLRSEWMFRAPVENVLNAPEFGPYNNTFFMDDYTGFEWDANYAQPAGNAADAQGNGVNQVSPFDPASPGNVYPLFSLPRTGFPLLSLAAFQHAPLSTFAWQPNYAMGNSYADPRVPRDLSVNHVPDRFWIFGNSMSTDGVASRWSGARQGMTDQAFLYDTSFELNYALWDSYFLSGIRPSGTPLPLNSRLIVKDGASDQDVRDGNLAATKLFLRGAFNVNSTSTEAWVALLSGFREKANTRVKGVWSGDAPNNEVAYMRHLLPLDGKPAQFSGTGVSDQSVWTGYQTLSNEQIRGLAEQIVVEVKSRGPFLSISDFINRRLVPLPTGKTSDVADVADVSSMSPEDRRARFALKGALQAAIDRTALVSGKPAINEQIAKITDANFVIPKAAYDPKDGNYQATYGSSKAPDPNFISSANVMNNDDAKRQGLKPDHNLWPDNKAVGIPAFVTQADILQKVGSTITARGDTFVIRVYGDAQSEKGEILARAYAEAVVQRDVAPMYADSQFPERIDASKPANLQVFGRRFKILSYRWLSPQEI